MKVLTLSLLLFVLVLAGCVSYQSPQINEEREQNLNEDEITSQPTTQPETEENKEDNKNLGNEPTSGEAQVREIRIVARQWEFEPNVIRVKKGERVRLIVTSEDVVHGLAFPDYGINKEIAPGNEVVIEFVADKGGEFQGFCSVYCGEGHSSMRLTLIVEEN